MAFKEPGIIKNEIISRPTKQLPHGLPLRISRVPKQIDVRNSMTNPNSHRKIPITGNIRPFIGSGGK